MVGEEEKVRGYEKGKEELKKEGEVSQSLRTRRKTLMSEEESVIIYKVYLDVENLFLHMAGIDRLTCVL